LYNSFLAIGIDSISTLLQDGHLVNLDLLPISICELAQVAYIAITAVILAKERTIKVAEKEQLR